MLIALFMFTPNSIKASYIFHLKKAAVASPTCLITEQRVLGLGLQGEVSSLLQEEWLIDWDDSEPPSAL